MLFAMCAPLSGMGETKTNPLNGTLRAWHTNQTVIGLIAGHCVSVPQAQLQVTSDLVTVGPNAMVLHPFLIIFFNNLGTKCRDQISWTSNVICLLILK